MGQENNNSENDLPMFSYDGTLGYNYGSLTSEQHMADEMKNAKTKQAFILSLFVTAGTNGLVSSEAEDKSKWKHQTVSSHIRNMELAGVLCKTEVIRNKQHVYIHSRYKNELNAPRTLPPTPQRSWKTNYDNLVSEITSLASRAIQDGDGYVNSADLLRIIKKQ